MRTEMTLDLDHLSKLAEAAQKEDDHLRSGGTFFGLLAYADLRRALEDLTTIHELIRLARLGICREQGLAPYYKETK